MTTSLPALLDELDRYDGPMPLAELETKLRGFDLTPEDVAPWVAFRDDGYCRNLVRLGEHYSALILCWKPGQQSPIHDHRGSGCCVRVVQGTVTEVRYDRGDDGMLSEASRSVYTPGHVCGSFDADIHTLINESTSGEDLITLHVYMPPMEVFSLYQLDSPKITECEDGEVAEARRQQPAAR